jgi:thiamine biosynthesis lipoprotein ApbE
MSRHQVLCVNKLKKENSTSKILNLGGLNSDGSRWRITIERAIAGIESGKWQFYIEENGQNVDIIIGSSNGKKFLKTENDNSDSNNLIGLPECPF